MTYVVMKAGMNKTPAATGRSHKGTRRVIILFNGCRVWIYYCWMQC